MWRIGVRDLQWRRRRFGIAAAATALVFAMTLVLSGLSGTVRREPHVLVDALGGDQWVVDEGVTGPFTARSVLPAVLADTFLAQPGVEAAEPVLLNYTSINRDTPLDFNVVASPPGGLADPAIADGRPIRRPGEAVVDATSTLDIGDRVTVGTVTVEIVGRAARLSLLFGGPTLFMELGDAQRAFFLGQPMAQAVLVKGQVDAVPDDLSVLGNDPVAADAGRALQRGTDIITTLSVLLWIVAAGILGSIIYLSALERTRDLAVLKAIGARSAALVGSVLLQAVVLSVGAAGLGVVISRVVLPLFPIHVDVTAGDHVRLAVLALAIAGVAGSAGVRRVLVVEPVHAFRGGR